MDITKDDLFCGNLMEQPEGSYKVHIIKKNDKNVLECCGFKINLGINIQGKTSNYDTKVNKSSTKNMKYLKLWSVKKNTLNKLVITGKLLNEDMTRVLEVIHYTGIVESQVERNLIITSKGMYCLIGPPKPVNKKNEMFLKFWIISGGGFPKNFIELYYTPIKKCTFSPDMMIYFHDSTYE